MKANQYEAITSKIVDQIEGGTAPWRKPWSNKQGRVSRPLRHNGKPYSGVNILILWSTAEDRGYASPFWMTYRQATELGGQVRKGEKSELIVYANKTTKKETNGDTGEETERRISFLKTYCVFNADQIDDLPDHFKARVAATYNNPDQAVKIADDFIAATGAEIRIGGDRAFYSPAHDFIGVPPFESFNSAPDYYSTKLHELTHWTRHEKRLAREFGRKRWGDEGYAVEELVAELGSAFLCADLGLELASEPRQDHASYLASWLQVLKNDSRAIFGAASHASRAADYLHSFQQSDAERAAA
jgi:antirestriction protein ArdC